MEIIINVTDIEYQALSVIAYDPQEYLTNFAKVRASNAIDEVVQNLIQEALSSGGTLPSGTKEEIFTSANIPTAKEVTDAEIARLNAGDTNP